jgi:hypothetical protein
LSRARTSDENCRGRLKSTACTGTERVVRRNAGLIITGAGNGDIAVPDIEEAEAVGEGSRDREAAMPDSAEIVGDRGRSVE